jgi:hypothetical protein
VRDAQHYLCVLLWSRVLARSRTVARCSLLVAGSESCRCLSPPTVRSVAGLVVQIGATSATVSDAT